MRTWLLPLLFCPVLLGCREDLIAWPDGSCAPGDMKMPTTPPDMTTVPPCPAAKGLTGDNLVCVDFANPQTTIADLSMPSKGWDFGFVMTNCPGWQIASSLLQVKDRITFVNGTCGFTPPQVTAAQLQKYSRITIAIQHRIDLSDPEQKAQLFLNDATDPQNLMWQLTGKKNVPRQQTTFTIDTADLPVLLKTGGFKWLLQISSQQAIVRDGWQISSIAINGSM